MGRERAGEGNHLLLHAPESTSRGAEVIRRAVKWDPLRKGLNRFGILLGKIIFKVRIYGEENIPDEPVILAANHQSYLDPALLTVLHPFRIRFLAKSELFKNPLIYPFLAIYSSIPLRRGKISLESFKEAFQSLEEGISVGIFPEGTRTRRRLPGKPGLGLLVARSKRSVLPVTVKHTGTALRNLLSPSREPIEIIYHPPIRFQVSENASKEELIEVSERVLDIIYSKL